MFEPDAHDEVVSVHVQPVRPAFTVDPVTQVVGQSVFAVAKPVELYLPAAHAQPVTTVPVPAAMVDAPGQAEQPLAPDAVGVP